MIRSTFVSLICLLIIGCAGQKTNKMPLDAEAQFQLGMKYYNAKKDSIARGWYEKAAQQGHTKAQSYLGVLYHSGMGGIIDYKIARYWYEKAATKGNTVAQNNLGALYTNGLGGTVNNKAARYWFTKVAKKGNAIAQNNLGFLYDSGRGGSRNYQTARYWYEKAAKQGNLKAQNNLGMLYFAGNGVTKNYDTAKYWIEKAAKRGLEEAKNNLLTLKKLDKSIFEKVGNFAKNIYIKYEDEINTGVIVLGGLATGYALSKSDYCFRPNDDCTNEQENKHEIFYKHVSNRLSYKPNYYKNKVCSNYEYLKDFLRNGGLAIFSSSIDVLSATMTGTFSGETLNNVQLLIDTADLTSQLIEDGHCHI